MHILLPQTTSLIAHSLWLTGLVDQERLEEIASQLGEFSTKEITTWLDNQFLGEGYRFVHSGLLKVRLFKDGQPLLSCGVEQGIDRVVPIQSPAKAYIQLYGEDHARRLGLIELIQTGKKPTINNFGYTVKDIDKMVNSHRHLVEKTIDQLRPGSQKVMDRLIPIRASLKASQMAV